MEKVDLNVQLAVDGDKVECYVADKKGEHAPSHFSTESDYWDGELTEFMGVILNYWVNTLRDKINA